MSGKQARDRRLEIGLAALQLFVGVGGVAGGLALVTDPRGTNLGFSLEVLEATPFRDYLIPGIVLLAVNGIGQVGGGIASFGRHRYAGEAAMSLGAFLMLWITAQVWWIGLLHWLQPLYFVLGLAEFILGGKSRR